MKNIIFFFAQALTGLVLLALSLITAVILLPFGIAIQLFMLCALIGADTYLFGKRIYQEHFRRRDSRSKD